MLKETNSRDTIPSTNLPQSRIQKMATFEWLGQTLASLFWIISVFFYGFADGNGLQLATGDWLQLGAASSWLASNIAVIVAIK